MMFVVQPCVILNGLVKSRLNRDGGMRFRIGYYKTIIQTQSL